MASKVLGSPPMAAASTSTGNAKAVSSWYLMRALSMTLALGTDSINKSISPPRRSSSSREPYSHTLAPSPNTAWAVLLMVSIWVGVRRIFKPRQPWPQAVQTSALQPASHQFPPSARRIRSACASKSGWSVPTFRQCLAASAHRYSQTCSWTG
jgi:hypothetical protein